MQLYDANGVPYNSESQKKVTKSQAGAILISELDMAIDKWNKEAIASCNGDRRKAHIFSVAFNQYQYKQEIYEKEKLFGYSVLRIWFEHQGQKTEVYNKGQNFAKQRDLENLNGYMPEMIFDCIGFLFASGFMYNLAIHNPNEPKEPKNAKEQTSKSDQPGSDTTGSDGNRNRPGNHKRGSRVSGRV